MQIDINPIKEELEKMECPIHGNHVKVIEHRGMVDYENICCPEFMIEIKERYKTLVREQTNDPNENAEDR